MPTLRLWHLVTLGVVMNIVSIILTSVLAEKLSGEIESLQSQKTDNLYSIQLAWSSVETLENKRDIYFLLKQENSTGSEMNVEQFIDYLTGWLVGIERSDVSDLNILSSIDQSQAQYREKIDDLYIINIGLSEKVSHLQSTLTWYKTIGLLFQVLGLVLILARDLRSK